MFQNLSSIKITGMWVSPDLIPDNQLVNSIKIKASGGGFLLKDLHSGTNLFKVTYAGYADRQITVYINEGVLTKVEMPLSKTV